MKSCLFQNGNIVGIFYFIFYTIVCFLYLVLQCNMFLKLGEKNQCLKIKHSYKK